jgi:hypothetical protein
LREARGQRYVDQRRVCVCELAAREFDAEPPEVLSDGKVIMSAKLTHQMDGVDADQACDLAYAVTL